jgi:hypothetical protein
MTCEKCCEKCDYQCWDCIRGPEAVERERAYFALSNYWLAAPPSVFKDAFIEESCRAYENTITITAEDLRHERSD